MLQTMPSAILGTLKVTLADQLNAPPLPLPPSPHPPSLLQFCFLIFACSITSFWTFGHVVSVLVLDKVLWSGLFSSVV